jgi:hypothetical protein
MLAGGGEAQQPNHGIVSFQGAFNRERAQRRVFAVLYELLESCKADSRVGIVESRSPFLNFSGALFNVLTRRR